MDQWPFQEESYLRRWGKFVQDQTTKPNQTEFCFIFVSNPHNLVESLVGAHKTVHHKLDTGVKKPASNTYIGDQGL